jgi:hypothetical protein
MAQTTVGLTAKYFFVDFFGGIVYFPIWWYTRGLNQAFLRVLNSVKVASSWLGLGIWVKNLFVPMYGETAWQGKLISFFVRLFMIIVRGIGVIAWACISFIFFLVYVVALPVAVLGIFYHTGGLLF